MERRRRPPRRLTGGGKPVRQRHVFALIFGVAAAVVAYNG